VRFDCLGEEATKRYALSQEEVVFTCRRETGRALAFHI
jgi:hypothetical protein